MLPNYTQSFTLTVNPAPPPPSPPDINKTIADDLANVQGEISEISRLATGNESDIKENAPNIEQDVKRARTNLDNIRTLISSDPDQGAARAFTLIADLDLIMLIDQQATLKQIINEPSSD